MSKLIMIFLVSLLLEVLELQPEREQLQMASLR